MYDSFDTNEMLFNLLNIAEIKNAISGSVYNDGRPLSSQKEDIVVSTISVTQAHKPQLATSNINIHVPDLKGLEIKDVARLKVITRLVKEHLNTDSLKEKSVYVSSQSTVQNPQTNEHFVNLRIEWRIYDTKGN